MDPKRVFWGMLTDHLTAKNQRKNFNQVQNQSMLPRNVYEYVSQFADACISRNTNVCQQATHVLVDTHSVRPPYVIALLYYAGKHFLEMLYKIYTISLISGKNPHELDHEMLMSSSKNKTPRYHYPCRGILIPYLPNSLFFSFLVFLVN